MSRRSTPGYEVAGPTRRCAATGRTLTAGERYVATLVRAPEGDALERHDFGLDAWEDGARPDPGSELIGSWRSVVPERDRPAHQLLSDEELLELFESLEGAEDPSRLAFRYVLTLLLMRKRELVHEGAAPGLLRVRTRGPRERTTCYEVVDPGLDESRIEAVSEQLEAVMAEPGDEA